MTTIVLTLVGMAITFGIGWNVGRTRTVRTTEPRASGNSSPVVSISDLIERHPTGVVIGDRNGRVEFRNAAARRLTGTHSGVLVDEAIEDLLATARSGTESHKVLEFYGPPKVVFDVLARTVPGGGSVVFIDDISERRRIDQVRTDFVANISHELKTPVGALAVLAETLVDETHPDTIQRVVARMLAETDRANRTIDDLMELSRIETGTEQANETVELADVVRAGVERVTQLASQRQIAVSSLAAIEGGATAAEQLVVNGDRRQIVSAVGNLVENAVKYSEPGSTVQVRLRRADTWAEVLVTDQGIGIPQRDLDRIFERFYRVDRARSRTTGGTGLGLSIVRHVASNHGGEVLVASTEGQGSTFTLRLPLGAHDPPDTAIGERPEGAA